MLASHTHHGGGLGALVLNRSSSLIQDASRQTSLEPTLADPPSGHRTIHDHGVHVQHNFAAHEQLQHLNEWEQHQHQQRQQHQQQHQHQQQQQQQQQQPEQNDQPSKFDLNGPLDVCLLLSTSGTAGEKKVGEEGLRYDLLIIFG